MHIILEVFERPGEAGAVRAEGVVEDLPPPQKLGADTHAVLTGLLGMPNPDPAEAADSVRRRGGVLWHAVVFSGEGPWTAVCKYSVHIILEVSHEIHFSYKCTSF